MKRMDCSFTHQPVLLPETLDLFSLKEGDRVLDGTFGLGGHALAILQQIGSKGHYYAFDLDATNLHQAKDRLSDHSEQLITFHDNFAHCQERLQEVGVTAVDAILLDLGLSSPHVDDAQRGFSIREEGPLDMRFDRSKGITAADVLNTWPQDDLRRIIYEYGEERYAPKLARLIVEHREQKRLETTTDLIDLIAEIMKSPGDKRRVATRVFQALRIAVNDELQVLESTLPVMLDLLAPGGRMVVISYHSLEDRLVKRAFKAVSKACICPPQVLRCECGDRPHYEILTKKPIVPTDQELEENPRSRSAKLRAILRTD
jgi:16S rRNA (cytosine1402-N4)-methyltransferase